MLYRFAGKLEVLFHPRGPFFRNKDKGSWTVPKRDVMTGEQPFEAALLMVEGRLQREGQVVHVIVSKCFDFTKMLGKLVQREAEDLAVLTLARGDEKSAPYSSGDKRSQRAEQAPKDAFHGGRNFK